VNESCSEARRISSRACWDILILSPVRVGETVKMRDWDQLGTGGGDGGTCLPL
jgi:hypothetical protein